MEQLRHSAKHLILCSTKEGHPGLEGHGYFFWWGADNYPFKLHLRFLVECNGKDIERFALYLAAPAGLNVSSTSSEN